MSNQDIRWLQRLDSYKHGSHDVTRLAFREGYLTNGEIWMEMIASRNSSSHTYNEETAHTIVRAVLVSYIGEFRALRETASRWTQERAAD